MFIVVLFPGCNRFQRERFASGLWADSDAVGDRMAEQVDQGGFVGGFELQVGVLDVAHQQTLVFQIGANALADRVDQPFLCLVCSNGWTLTPSK
ncbi:MAG: hypothetical protein U5R46_02735 [Gammaproteobacteria bacterium]|nr:hypothetical protein [Gammaproteobacteria bacterium]